MSTGTIIRHAAATIAVLASSSSIAGDPGPAQPAPVEFGGHYYQVVLAPKVSWEQAKAAAEEASHQGIQGRLVTIGTAEEDVFVDTLRKQALAANPGYAAEMWAGGYQVACATDQPEPACGWLWLNGESIAPVNGTDPYTNWHSGEPNNLTRAADAYTRPTEDYLAIGSGNAFGWNDEGYLKNIGGYVIEYGDKVVIPAADCVAGGSGCNPTGAQVFEYPASAKVADGATLTAETFRFRDDPARCGREPLSLFGGRVIIPPYLCGHPDFIVVETTSTGVEIPTGAILVENLTEDVLPDNLYGCTAERQNPVGVVDPDPTHRDVVAWQAADSARMLETTAGTGRFFGTLAEVTYGCGSSRGKILAGSYHFVGLQIHPGEGNEYIDNPHGNHQSLVDVTEYKLQVLRASVDESKVALPKLTYVAMRVLADAALYFHNRGQFKLALLNVKLLLAAGERAKYKVVPDRNFHGELVMRGSNIEYMYTEKLIPYKN